MSAVILTVEKGHPSYDTAIAGVNKARKAVELLPVNYGDTLTVLEGELSPEEEARCRRFAQKKAEVDAQRAQAGTGKPAKSPKAKRSNYGRWGLLNNWVDYGQHYFSTAECAVWLTIFRLSDGETNTVKFGVRDLADRAGVSKNTADSAVRKFVEEGVLVCVNKSSWKGVPSIYRLNDATERLTRRPSNPK